MDCGDMNTGYVIFDGLCAGRVRLPKFSTIVGKMAVAFTSILFEVPPFPALP
jgi:hypothetical protein